MPGVKPATFTVDGVEYPIKPSVFRTIQSHLYDKEHVEWVTFEEPNVKYGVKTKTGEVKTVVRLASELLNGSDLGRAVIAALSLQAVNK